ncbi:hypothetical protein MKEN_00095800 [Mycena kentingensis (nom. inval.)]|nr:hypothetical protein MKEN_00095800 [Mycena kentingensis (nom. inval.)]
MSSIWYLAVLKASYDYSPEPGADDEISIKEDQILFLKERVDNDWWKVKIKGDTQEDDTPVGLVPAAYVEPAEHSSVVKALYDYEAAAPGELSITEDQILIAFDAEDEWLLVQTDEDGGKAGYVPANYVEPHTGEDDEPAPVAAPQIVVPDSPPKPAYVDPAARVASSKITADDIKTWSVSEVDKKGKKKKGTLGIGNGAVFFASESDKTPVQKWQTAHINSINVEKSKHVHIDVGGPNPITLHFSVGSKENADAIVTKLNSSKELSSASPEEPASPRAASPPREQPKKASVHFAHPDSPTVIPAREDSEEEEAPEDSGDYATALYDFEADGADELSVTEGEQLIILERDGDEWWKCRNAKGNEGVVPASYLEAGGGDPVPDDEDDEEENRRAAAAAAAAREAEERTEAERQRKVREKERADKAARAERERAEEEEREQERAEQERQEKERKRQEAQKRAKDAAAIAEKERQKRKQAVEARPSPSPAPRPAPETKKPESKSSSTRASPDPVAMPPADRVRTWHDRTGQFRVDAAFLGYNNGKLRLHKVNGVIVEVPAEKMSAEDMKYVERITNKNRPSRTATAAAAGPSRKMSDDDVPLAMAKRASLAVPQKKGPTVDWFDFFLTAGCDLDDCTRYAAAFERDKIDESVLLDITESTMRSLGLREGDIIRVTKAIDKRRPADKKQDEGGEVKSPPNLFTTPGGALKSTSMRRGRPQAKSSLPATVDLQSISSSSDKIQRTNSPQTITPTTVQPPPRTSSTLVAAGSGFDDDAWTNRPSSTQPVTVMSPASPVAARAPSAPPTTAPAATPAAAPAPAATAPAPVTHAATPPVVTTPPSLAKTTESDVFDQLARLAALRSQTPQTVATPPVASPPIVTATPTGYVSGLGMGSSPLSMGQHLANQPTPQPSPQPPTAYTGPRGPYAPVPANQSLLQPLIPTTTGFNNFVPTRSSPATTSPFGSTGLTPSFIPTQPTGFPGAQPLQAQPTGFPMQPISFQPTGAPFAGNSFVQSNPTGVFAQSPFGNNASPFNNPSPFNGSSFSPSPPPVPPLPSSQTPSTAPANIFAQMKSGTFGAEDNANAPQSADRYDALRPNPMAVQPTGWGGGYQNGGFGYQ